MTRAAAAILIAAVCCSAPAPAAALTGFGPYRTAQVQVIDGDTIVASIEIWPGLIERVHVRFLGIDTPELHRGPSCERALAVKAKNYLTALLAGKNVAVTIVRIDKYGGRYDGNVTANGTDVASALIAAGLGRQYDGGPRDPWC